MDYRTVIKGCFIAMFYLCSLAEAFADPHFVVISNTNASPPYLTWDTAATNIQSAINEATGGDTVIVSSGTFRPPAQLVVTNGITLCSANGSSNTTVNGNSSHSCFLVNHANAVVDGFTITGGSASAGAGVAMGNGTIRNCLITGNTATSSGGGLYATNGLVENCIFNGNHAPSAAGAYLYQGGMLRNCLFWSNLATGGGGGGVGCNKGGTLQNCMICYNNATTNGGGLFVSSNTVVRNTIVYFNTCSAGVSSNYYNSQTNWTYDHCCLSPLLAVNGNIDTDPLFAIDLAHPYHLQAGSPCVDAGTEIGVSPADKDGVGRPLDGNADGVAATDIGPYEFINSIADSDHDGQTDTNEVTAGTDPTDSNSVFEVSATKESQNFILTWASASNRIYDLSRLADLTDLAGATNLSLDMPATPPWNYYTDAVDQTIGFYRLTVTHP